MSFSNALVVSQILRKSGGVREKLEQSGGDSHNDTLFILIAEIMHGALVCFKGYSCVLMIGYLNA